ncbi:CCDC77 [Lepeophtheirus salmonis]|uniref:CCDC77 n=1 Tax=Lepeophtheirus salmonis TaxID=72036 RepID=A0A7R8H336_LEPSM|nr:CCDC77 [Lepeophtheirus salmonis]CAF2835873.1 CCDC77 [Lepeophtheirus salmonis]
MSTNPRCYINRETLQDRVLSLNKLKMRDVGVTEGLLKNLPPSKELLEFYKSKLSTSRERERLLLDKWKESGFYYGSYKGVQAKLDSETSKRRDALSTVEDLKDALHQERTLTRKLYAQNHGYAARELENRRKIQALVHIAGKIQGDIAKVLDTQELSLDMIPIPSELQRYIDENPKPSPRIPTKDALVLELSVASKQKKNDCIVKHYETRLEDCSRSLINLERVHKDLAKDFVQEKEKFHQCESTWEKEKEKWIRKVQFLEQYGTNVPGMNVDAGAFYTSKRVVDRKMSNNNKALHDVNRELKDMKSELDHLRDKNASQKEEANELLLKLKSRIDVHKNRFEDLESRRKLEMEGYQSDLVAATVGKSKEHNYLQTIRQQEEEIEKLNKFLKKNPDWR